MLIQGVVGGLAGQESVFLLSSFRLYARMDGEALTIRGNRFTMAEKVGGNPTLRRAKSAKFENKSNSELE